MEFIYVVFILVGTSSVLSFAQEPNIDKRIDTIIGLLSDKCMENTKIDIKMDAVLTEIRGLNTQTEIDRLVVRMQNIENDYIQEKKLREALENQLKEVSNEVKRNDKQRSSSKSVSTYIRWGRHECPLNGTRTMYDGYAAGGQHSHKGTGVSMLCLPREPIWGKYVDTLDGVGDFIYGAEYQHVVARANAILGKSVHDQDVPCAVCESDRSTNIMIPGRTTCYAGWTREYWGYLMSGHYDHPAQGDYHCVDSDPSVVEGGKANENGYLLYFVEVRCGSLKCPPYIMGRELPCVVCTK